MKQIEIFGEETESLSSATARPFLKWAGGKGQLTDQIEKCLPAALQTGEIKRYVEPFVGGGAVLFHIIQHHPIKEIFISDINPELILTYKTIQSNVKALTTKLCQLQTDYLALDEGGREKMFYAIREAFNKGLKTIQYEEFQPNWIERAAQIIFMNKTCFNGLFRVNSKGQFNVPFGKYKKPNICDTQNLLAVSQMLQRVHIWLGDFSEAGDFINQDTFVYFDPPYRPLSKTSHFKSYAKGDFNDAEQTRLAEFYRQMDARGALLMLSNSDPKNENAEDDFFDKLYEDFNIARVKANRTINSKAEKRGAIDELLILNYEGCNK